MCLGLMLGLSGCRHQVKVAPLPMILVPVPLLDVPPPGNPEMVEVPSIKLPPAPIAAAAARFPRERKRQVVKAEPPAATPPVVTPPPVTEAAAIGALTAGAETNPQAKQDAADLIGSNEKRLGALPAQKAEDEKAQISTVKNFQRQAQDALSSGDAEGAKTLAVKAKLLLDDLEK
jgi:hypothetical protein